MYSDKGLYRIGTAICSTPTDVRSSVDIVHLDNGIRLITPRHSSIKVYYYVILSCVVCTIFRNIISFSQLEELIFHWAFS